MVDTDLPLIDFTAEDRCDRCGAQAYTMAQHEDMASELLFCLHHAREHRNDLVDEGWTVIDDYEAIERLTSPNYDVAAV